MKQVTLTVLLTTGLFVALITSVQAELPEDFRVQFQELYVEEGVEQAVSEGVRNGIAAYIIMEVALGIPDMNPEELVKAMYCAGISGANIRSASVTLGVTDQLVVSGFKKSIGECKRWLVGGFAGLPEPSSGGNFASTSGFVQN